MVSCWVHIGKDNYLPTYRPGDTVLDLCWAGGWMNLALTGESVVRAPAANNAKAKGHGGHSPRGFKEQRNNRMRHSRGQVVSGGAVVLLAFNQY